MPTPIGDIITLTSGTTTARIATLAAALIGVTVGDVEIVETTPPTRLPSHGHGIVLAPWPNRVRGAQWVHNGDRQYLDVTDPSRGNAIHGLLRNTAYRVLAQTDDTVTLGAAIYPQHGWPFRLDTWVRYAATNGGLTVTHGVTNTGSVRAPWAVGAHPYFRVGEVPVSELSLVVHGADRYLVLDESLVPTGLADVKPGSALDLRTPVFLAGADLNVAYQDVATGTSGVAELIAPSGARTIVWQDEAFRWLQVFTPGDFPHVAADGTETPTLAVALEPMTAAPNALNTGEGLVWLEPGQNWEASWGARYEEKA